MAFNQSDIESFYNATSENPVFIHGTFWTELPNGREAVASRGTAAIMGQHQIDDPYGYDEDRFRVAYLDQEVIGDPKWVRREFGDWDLIKLSDVPDGEVVFDPAVQDRYHKWQDLHENSPYMVQGRLYSETPEYLPFDPDHSHPQYMPIKETEHVWDLTNEHLKDGSSIKSLEAVEKWMLENHPAYYMGYTVSQQCPSGDFCANTIPGGGYPEGTDDTFAHRMEYAKSMADSLGVEVGPDETKDALQELKQTRDVTKKERRLPDISRVDFDIPNGPDYMMPGDY